MPDASQQTSKQANEQTNITNYIASHTNQKQRV